MRLKMKIDDALINDMDLDITIRMKVSEWRALTKQSEHTWPASELGMRISTALGYIAKASDATFIDPPRET